MIPAFNRNGYLPPGKHVATWKEFELRFATNEVRNKLIVGMKSALINLKNAGCRTVYIDGSFVTVKKKPNDWDGCWELEGVDNALLDSVILFADMFPNDVRRKYLGDLLQQAPRFPGRDYITFFQRDRKGNKKGIIVIKLETFPCY